MLSNLKYRDLSVVSLRKQPTFHDATTGFPAKWRLRNDYRNSILMTRHYSHLGSASDWLNQISHAARPIRSTTQIAKCRLFSQASKWWAGQLFAEGEKIIILDSGYLCTGFRIPCAGKLGFRIPKDSWIPDFKAQHFRVPQTEASRIADSASKSFPDFGIRITLHVGTGGTRHRNAGFALAT